MWYVAVSEADEVVLAAKFAVMRPFLDERGWRVYLGTEARALGYGGIAAVARSSGASQATVAAGAAEAADAESLAALEPGRSRRPGAGRPKAEDVQPGLSEALGGLLEAGKRGDPVSALAWNTLSLRDVARQMAVLGFGCSKDTVARLMRADGYSLQGMSRVLEGKQHADRDAQFRHINARIAGAVAAGDPVISVDTKKKEQLGPFYRRGQSWRPQGDPVKVRDHDFADPALGRVVPYGIYDIAANRGFVSVGVSHDTAAFAVAALRLWWQREGAARYPAARRLLVVCDAGGSNSVRCHLWKDQLARFAAATGLQVSVCHFPPGTSKWNKIEHRLFSHITRTWRTRPLASREDAVAGIAATVTAQGLKCTAVPDDASYPDGITISKERIRCLQDQILDRDVFHGEWNYSLRPVPPPPPAAAQPPQPPPCPGRVPAAVLNHPALTGMTAAGLTALAQALDIPFGAHFQQHNYTTRGGPRKTAVRSSGPHGNRRLTVTDHLLALRLRDHLDLPVKVIAVLLGIDTGTASHAITLAASLLATARITPPAASPPPDPLPRTPAALLACTAQAGITLTLPENGQTMPDQFKTRRKRTP
jgi:hypothetical protein